MSFCYFGNGIAEYDLILMHYLFIKRIFPHFYCFLKQEGLSYHSSPYYFGHSPSLQRVISLKL